MRDRRFNGRKPLLERLLAPLGGHLALFDVTFLDDALSCVYFLGFMTVLGSFLLHSGIQKPLIVIERVLIFEVFAVSTRDVTFVVFSSGASFGRPSAGTFFLGGASLGILKDFVSALALKTPLRTLKTPPLATL